MKITAVESRHADAGHRNFDFLNDRVPWYDELVTHPPEIRDGHLLLSPRPGWGTEVDEAAVRAHPPRRR